MAFNHYTSISIVTSILIFSSGTVIGTFKDKRQVIVNPYANFKFGLNINAPFSCILPTLVGENKLGFNRRSFNSGPQGNYFNETFDDPETAQNIFIDPGYGIQINKLMTLFALLEIGKLSCQERLICELAVDTETYSPVSELILRQIKPKNGPVTQTEDSIMWRFMVAAREGIVADDKDSCQRLYPTCLYPAYSLLNMPVIKVWQFIASKINLHIL